MAEENVETFQSGTKDEKELAMEELLNQVNTGLAQAKNQLVDLKAILLETLECKIFETEAVSYEQHGETIEMIENNIEVTEKLISKFESIKEEMEKSIAELKSLNGEMINLLGQYKNK